MKTPLPNSEKEGFRLEEFSSKSDKKSPFQVPDGYFENLTPKIMHVVNAAQSNATAASPFGWIFRPMVWAPALSVVLLLGAAYVFFYPTAHENGLAQEELNISDLEDLDLLDDYDVVAYAEIPTAHEVYEELDEEEVMDFILDQDITSSSLFTNDITL